MSKFSEVLADYLRKGSVSGEDPEFLEGEGGTSLDVKEVVAEEATERAASVVKSGMMTTATMLAASVAEPMSYAQRGVGAVKNIRDARKSRLEGKRLYYLSYQEESLSHVMQHVLEDVLPVGAIPVNMETLHPDMSLLPEDKQQALAGIVAKHMIGYIRKKAHDGGVGTPETNPDFWKTVAKETTRGVLQDQLLEGIVGIQGKEAIKAVRQRQRTSTLRRVGASMRNAGASMRRRLSSSSSGYEPIAESPVTSRPESPSQGVEKPSTHGGSHAEYLEQKLEGASTRALGSMESGKHSLADHLKQVLPEAAVNLSRDTLRESVAKGAIRTTTLAGEVAANVFFPGSGEVIRAAGNKVIGRVDKLGESRVERANTILSQEVQDGLVAAFAVAEPLIKEAAYRVTLDEGNVEAFKQKSKEEQTRLVEEYFEQMPEAQRREISKSYATQLAAVALEQQETGFYKDKTTEEFVSAVAGIALVNTSKDPLEELENKRRGDRAFNKANKVVHGQHSSLRDEFAVAVCGEGEEKKRFKRELYEVLVERYPDVPADLSLSRSRESSEGDVFLSPDEGRIKIDLSSLYNVTYDAVISAPASEQSVGTEEAIPSQLDASSQQEVRHVRTRMSGVLHDDEGTEVTYGPRQQVSPDSGVMGR